LNALVALTSQVSLVWMSSCHITIWTGLVAEASALSPQAAGFTMFVDCVAVAVVDDDEHPARSAAARSATATRVVGGAWRIRLRVGVGTVAFLVRVIP
jgi:hypothetical protein